MPTEQRLVSSSMQRCHSSWPRDQFLALALKVLALALQFRPGPWLSAIQPR